MNLLDNIVETIRSRGALRTPILAPAFAMSEESLDTTLAPLCAPGGPLVSCDVEVAGERVKEYRASTIGGGKLLAHSPIGRPRTSPPKKTNPAFGSAKAVTQALSARFKSAPPAPPPAVKPATPRKEADATMSIASRIIAAIKKLGPMTVPQVRSVVDEEHVSTICSQLARKKQLLKLGGGYRGAIYGLPGQKATAAKDDKPVRGAKRGGRTSMRKRAARPAPAVASASGAFRPAIASDGALLLMGAATPGELSPSETRVLAEFLRRVDRTGVRA